MASYTQLATFFGYPKQQCEMPGVIWRHGLGIKPALPTAVSINEVSINSVKEPLADRDEIPSGFLPHHCRATANSTQGVQI
ncbi:hypothetical protein Dda3937_02497 [Dickeya dadantii 3937]|uniref:Uncharacterized protein n=1 Tax=Dickeya dadantii (strain 3937) TaxID=198628 RepID=E0SE39_DICD3|nr:hypothetical protein Dda3937_02497 [Dickeya dadantii 3937]